MAGGWAVERGHLARLPSPLPDTDLQAALQVAEVLRSRIATLDLNSLTGGLPVRVSIGVAQLSEELMGAGSLVSAADSAMYLAKAQGRDRVIVAAGSEGGSMDASAE